MELNFNINHYVKIRLTSFGEYLIKNRYGKQYYEHEIEKSKDDRGYISMQLWVVMQLFGSELGGTVLPFEPNISIPYVREEL